MYQVGKPRSEQEEDLKRPDKISLLGFHSLAVVAFVSMI